MSDVFRRSLGWLFVSLPVLFGCTEPFEPPVDERQTDILVVEGIVNASDSTALVKLSRARPLSQVDTSYAEPGAAVSIHSSAGDIFTLKEETVGNYVAYSLPIDKSVTYRLNITTANGTDYVSDTVSIKSTPPIDSLSFGVTNDNMGLSIRLTTHDDSGQSRYYAWSYTETYEYHAAFNSGYKFIDGVPIIRTPEERIDKCWRSISSTDVLIGTSQNLTKDIISEQELNIIPKYSPKISVRYSILIEQRVLSSQEFEYLSLLKKTTEGQGTLFDGSPGPVVGNIHQANDYKAVVLGYFGGSEIIRERHFLTFNELPEVLREPPSKDGCQLSFTCDNTQPRFTNFIPPCFFLEDLSSKSAIIGVFSGGTNPTSYTFTKAQCADCRLQGGITTPPDFW
ncbi:DUF4249 domain-containing protein [uncultured Imperialibacter sp.]|uniref:DUF4249 domain-containing protein n=1 Tax=uncultured Imperialibacter sp. TaxID=1672639 RepID=UPI0030D7EEDD|tara:strand:+ start:620 stop:1807 length:1188 start_codon:yes stop_codon:yes gene_type:complete